MCNSSLSFDREAQEKAIAEAQRVSGDAPARIRPMLGKGRARVAVKIGDIDLSEAEWNVLLGLLAPTECRRIQQYLRPRDRLLALGSVLLQRALIRWTFNLSNREVIIDRDRKGKPGARLSPRRSRQFRNWNYNVSHHGLWVVAVAEAEGRVGVDLVDLEQRPMDDMTPKEFLRCFSRQLDEEEMARIHAKEEEGEQAMMKGFYKLWAVKEAMVKATGEGLTFDVKRIHVMEGGMGDEGDRRGKVKVKMDGKLRKDWSVEWQPLNATYAVCVARKLEEPVEEGEKVDGEGEDFIVLTLAELIPSVLHYWSPSLGVASPILTSPLTCVSA